MPSVGPREKNVFCTFFKNFFLLFFKNFFVLFLYFLLYFFRTFFVLFLNFFNGLGFKPKSKSKFSPKRLDEYRSYFQYYRRILSPTIFQILGKIYCTDIEKWGIPQKITVHMQYLGNGWRYDDETW